MIALRQTWQVSLRYLRVLLRQPAFVVITLVQPLIWLLLFGALFKAVTQIPGFAGGSYLDYLTPGVVVMLAVSSAGWTGMGFIEDIEQRRDGPDARLARLARRVQPRQRRAVGDLGARPDGADRRAGADRSAPTTPTGRRLLFLRRRAAGGDLRVALERDRRARAPARDADRRGQPRCCCR